jgi:MYXO-CTERM domain-containing protein
MTLTKTTGSLAVASAIALSSANAWAIPVIPGAVGFGIETPAGRGGKVYKVTTLAASGTGSLRACVDATGPRVCVFEISGVIPLTSNLTVKNPYLTIAGQTAPSPGIMIRGAGLVILTHDVLVQHIRVRPGDDPNGPAGTNRDALSIANPSSVPYNVVIDHCSFGWSVDEMISTWYEVGDITFRHILAAEALDDSIHIDEGSSTTDLHGFGPLFGAATGGVAVYGSLLAHMRARQPMSIIAELVFVNNVVYDRLQEFSHLHNRNGIRTDSSFVGNVYIEGPALANWAASSTPIRLSNEFTLASKLHVADNLWSQKAVTDPWELVKNQSGQSRAAVEAKTPPTWVDGLTAKPTANDQALEWVLAHAGARPADRDSVEKRIVADVVNKTGTVINCVAADGSARCSKNAGGWPKYEQNSRTLALPQNPDADDDGDGYTNLEEWLHELASEVEGGTGNGGSGGSSGTAGDGGSAGTSGNGGSAGGGNGGATAGGGGSSAGSSSGGASNGSAGAAATSNADDTTDVNGSCGCRLEATSGRSAPGVLAALAALLLLRLRRRRQS